MKRDRSGGESEIIAELSDSNPFCVSYGLFAGIENGIETETSAEVSVSVPVSQDFDIKFRIPVDDGFEVRLTRWGVKS